MTVILSACGGGTGGGLFSSSSIDMEDAKATKAVPILNEDNAPQCQINLQVKYMKGDDEVAKNINNAIMERLFQMTNLTMQQAVDSFANYYSHEYQKNMAPSIAKTVPTRRNTHGMNTAIPSRRMPNGARTTVSCISSTSTCLKVVPILSVSN